MVSRLKSMIFINKYSIIIIIMGTSDKSCWHTCNMYFLLSITSDDQQRVAYFTTDISSILTKMFTQNNNSVIIRFIQTEEKCICSVQYKTGMRSSVNKSINNTVEVLK